MRVITGITPTAPKIMIYGLAGVGKSTLASKLSKPIFMDFEGGVNYLDVPRTPVIPSDEVFVSYLMELWHAAEDGKKEYDTIVIDSADWMMRKFVEKAAEIRVLNPKTKKYTVNLKAKLSKANDGYGGGQEHLQSLVRTDLIPKLNALNEKGYAICLIAHAERKEMLDGDGIASDRIAPKIDKRTMDVMLEWVDFCFYLKQNGDNRIISVDESNGSAIAKNRIGLTGEYDIDEIDINELLMPKKEDK